MTSLVHNKSSWILGDGCLEPLGRLWTHYRSKAPARLSQSTSLEKLKNPQSINGPSLLVDHETLNLIENVFKGPDGRSFGKTHAVDFNSRILWEVSEVYADASLKTQEAIILLNESTPWVGRLLNKMISWVIPIYHERYDRPFRRGTSHIDYLGLIFTSFLERKSQDPNLAKTVLAIDLAHELGHQALMLYQLTDPILSTPLTAPIYSSIRRENRPAIMALHAGLASSYMMEVCHAVISSSKFSDIEKTYAANSLGQLQRQQTASLKALKTSVRFTELGAHVFADLENQLEQMDGLVKNISDEEPLSYFGLLKP